LLGKRVHSALEELLQTATNEITELQNAGVHYLVINMEPIFATTQNSGFGQCVQMTGNIGLSRTYLSYQLADVFGTRLKEHDELETQWLTECFEATSHQSECLL
jgi:hypothetical protein